MNLNIGEYVYIDVATPNGYVHYEGNVFSVDDKNVVLKYEFQDKLYIDEINLKEISWIGKEDKSE